MHRDNSPEIIGPGRPPPSRCARKRSFACQAAAMSQARKALINSPETVVCEAIEGLVSATPHLARLDGFPSVSTSCRANSPQLVDTGHSSQQGRSDRWAACSEVSPPAAWASTPAPASQSAHSLVCYGLLSADQSCCGHHS